ncbi:13767_t:CDS:2 [Gigaspora rosea]|nr:13767_t:CDS:2 [Gigaspora rosea]
MHIYKVEWAMCTLSGKLASITLLIDTFDSHLDSQSKAIIKNLPKKTHAKKILCILWSRNLIFGKNVIAQYIEDNLSLFQIEDNKKELDFLEMVEKHEKSATFLAENSGFFPPVLKGQDRYFLNLIHIL